MLASELGCLVQGPDPVPFLVAHLRDRRMLIVLDNCEHVVEAVALLSGKLLRKLQNEAVSIAFDRAGRVYISNWKTVDIYSKGGAQLLEQIDKRAASVAVDPHTR